MSRSTECRARIESLESLHSILSEAVNDDEGFVDGSFAFHHQRRTKGDILALPESSLPYLPYCPRLVVLIAKNTIGALEYSHVDFVLACRVLAYPRTSVEATADYHFLMSHV